MENGGKKTTKEGEARAGAGATEGQEARELIAQAFALARALGIRRLLVRAELVSDANFVRKSRLDEEIVWITNARDFEAGPRDKVVFVPDLRLSRFSQIKIGLFVAVLRRFVRVDESIVCLSGVAGAKRIDTLVITNPKRDFPWLRGEDFGPGKAKSAETEALETVLQVALAIAERGYEGKPVGTVIVLGKEKQLAPHMRQLILNPLEGHPEKARSIRNPEFLDTLRELAALDGAFFVNDKGIVKSAATYLDAPTQGVRVRAGLGARHMAGAAITRVTEATAVVVSESTGAVSVFRHGKMVLELEKPGPKPQRRSR